MSLSGFAVRKKYASGSASSLFPRPSQTLTGVPRRLT